MRARTDLTLPDWWHPLADKAATTEGEPWVRLAPPNAEGRHSAVLILFGEGAHEGQTGPDVLICQRAANMNNHAGQPAFPGGGSEPGDTDAVATALREANEEVGLDPASVVVVTSLPEVWISVSNFRVTPVLAWWRDPHPVHARQREEVASVVRVPVSELVDPANRVRAKHPSGYVGPAFQVRDLLVWGFTAGILSAVLDLADWSRPWGPGRLVPVS
ncbi:NUDIX hydrolase [Phytomonospora endophytica]|uniref:8-oxo-dGTP pyrophosphatase MutT (NUDIX family) n=1 Tax=Phytomonospora endophytica TaxID=714109 RepID=A0A841FI04_9ACTN|nr:CoA pyrophosphatase [Phytomonospora endophytica]MBB6035375.1 8-oxo-dGTP pyrophosphatase MutT (NUDIX family) [Phytomonospora endophytica]GIG63873.1 coenzyme A pyrophosphatase [Phytomonospora endophytica]